MTDLLYLSIAFAGLASLAAVLVLIGRAASDCPETGGAARVASLVVTTGFSAIGAGVILLIASALPVLMQGRVMGLYVALGLVALVLGVGFYNAASAMREILSAAPKSAKPAVEQVAA